MARRYEVRTAHDDGPGYLQDRLKEVAENGGRVVSVMWIPERSAGGKKAPSVYTIVSEHEDKYA
jgi:hypothetical protein